nr:hypothetical protein [Paraburkholderia elongata]
MSNSPVAAAIPAAIAALLPRFSEHRISRTDAKRSTISAVPSVEPSSTTMISPSKGWAQATASTVPMRGASL